MSKLLLVRSAAVCAPTPSVYTLFFSEWTHGGCLPRQIYHPCHSTCSISSSTFKWDPGVWMPLSGRGCKRTAASSKGAVTVKFGRHPRLTRAFNAFNFILVRVASNLPVCCAFGSHKVMMVLLGHPLRTFFHLGKSPHSSTRHAH